MLTGALLTSVLAFGETFTDGNGLRWEYTVDKSSGKATLSSVERVDGQTVTGTLVIPSTVTNDSISASAPVTTIAANAFRGLPITGLTFAEGVETICYGAFKGCTSLETLVLPDSLVTITGWGVNSSGVDGAFSGCTSLRSVKLGNGLRTIGDGYRAYNGSPDPYAYSGVFGNCDALEEVEFGANLVTIGNHAFS